MNLEENDKKINNLFRSIDGTFAFLLKRKFILLILFIIGGIIGVFIARSSVSSYKSRLTFSLDEGSQGGLSGVAGIAAQFGLMAGNGGGTGIFSGNNIIEILKSRRMIGGVLLNVDTFDNKPITLIDYYLHLKNPNKKQIILFPVSELGNDNRKFSHIQDSMLYVTYNNIIGGEIKISKPDLQLDIYELNFTSTDEKFTKIFTDRLLEETTKFYTDLKTKKNKETVDILEERVATLKSGVNTSITARASSLDANLNTALAVPQVPVQKQQVNLEVYAKAYEELYKNLELAKYQLLQSTPLLQVIDEANYPMEKVKVSRIKYALVFGFLFAAIASCTLLLIRKIKR